MPDSAQTLAWKDVAAWLFCGGWSAIGLFVAGKISSMSTSVEKLNVNVAVVIEKVGNHEKRIEKLEFGERDGNHESRIWRLEAREDHINDHDA